MYAKLLILILLLASICILLTRAEPDAKKEDIEGDWRLVNKLICNSYTFRRTFKRTFTCDECCQDEDYDKGSGTIFSCTCIKKANYKLPKKRCYEDLRLYKGSFGQYTLHKDATCDEYQMERGQANDILDFKIK